MQLKFRSWRVSVKLCPYLEVTPYFFYENREQLRYVLFTLTRQEERVNKESENVIDYPFILTKQVKNHLYSINFSYFSITFFSF